MISLGFLCDVSAEVSMINWVNRDPSVDFDGKFIEWISENTK